VFVGDEEAQDAAIHTYKYISMICKGKKGEGGLTRRKTWEKSDNTLSMSSSPKVLGKLCSFKKLGLSPLTSRQMSSKRR